MAGTAQPMGQTQIPMSPLATQTKGNYQPPQQSRYVKDRFGGATMLTPGAQMGGGLPAPGGLPDVTLQDPTSFADPIQQMSTMNRGVTQPRTLTWQPPSGMPEGFTGGAGGRAITPWTNSVTGETWNAPNTGYRPPSSDWQLSHHIKGGGTATYPELGQEPIPRVPGGGDLRNRPNPAFEGIDMSGFKPPRVGSADSRHYYINGVEQVGGSTHIAALRSYLESIGQGDVFSENRPDSFSQPINTKINKYGGVNSETGAGIPMQPGQNTPRIGGGSTNPEALGGGGTAGQTQQPTVAPYTPTEQALLDQAGWSEFPEPSRGDAETQSAIPLGAQQPANINTLAAEGIKAAGYSTGQGLDFAPSDVSADNIYSSTVAPGTVSSGSYTPGMVTPNQLATTGLDPYMNPYTQQVIEANEADILRGADMGLDALGAQAQAAKAFGGSRHGIAMGEMGGKVAEQLARSSAGLRQANFAQAQQAAQQDIGTNLQGQLANQGAGLQAGLANVGTGLQANLANQQTGLQSSLANQANLYNTGLANQSANLQAALANQGAGMQGQGMRLGAANQLANISNLGFGMGQQVSQNLAAQGAMQQALQQAVMEAAKQKYAGYTGHPALGLQYLNNALGITPYGETTTKSKQPGLFDYLTLATTAYTGMPS